MSQAEAIREALAELGVDAPTADVSDFIKKKHPKLELNEKTLPQAVSTTKKKLRNAGAAETPLLDTPKRAAKVVSGESFTEDEIKAVKTLLAAVSGEKARRLIDLIG